MHIDIAIYEKDRIQGAYLLLKRYKNRLKNFDQAIHNINKSKVDLTEFNELKVSLDHERYLTYAKDMQKLFDSTIDDMKVSRQLDRSNLERLIQKSVNALQ